MNHEMVRITCGRVSILEEKIILPILLLNFSSDSWISVSLFFFFLKRHAYSLEAGPDAPPASI